MEPFPTSVFKVLIFKDTATTEIYTRMLNDNQGGMSGGPVVQQRDAARRDYEQALCVLPKLQEAARRTGIPAGLIYRNQPAARQ